MKNLYAALAGVITCLLMMAVTTTVSAQGCSGSSSHNSDYSSSWQSAPATYSVVSPLKVTTTIGPNPTSGVFTVKIAANRQLSYAPKIEVLGLDGRVVAAAEGAADQKEFEASFDLRNARGNVFFVRTNCEQCRPQKVVVNAGTQF